jgi:inorganic pyrophosphatase
MHVSNIAYNKLDPYDKDKDEVRIIIESPRGSRNKLKFDEKLGIFKLSTVLGEGLSFPYDFGFIPATKGEDGDPLDVLLLMDEPVYPGVMVPARLLGVIRARQAEKDEMLRNDRLIAAAIKSIRYKNIETVNDLPTTFMEQIALFFKFYNDAKDKEFEVIYIKNKKHADKLLKEGIKRYEKKIK